MSRTEASLQSDDASVQSDSLVSLIRKAQDRHYNKRAVVPNTLPAAADFYVPTLPAAPESRYTVDDVLPVMYAGHLPASWSITGDGPGGREADATSDARLFFLLVKRMHVAERERLVIWFNGGPGCSSFDGALLEIGPALVNGTGSAARLQPNPGRWNEYANILFIDQPAGTGYSYLNRGQGVSELAPAAEQIVNFLGNLYTIFPEYGKMDTYLAGESYAGMSIPYLAKAMLATPSLPSSSALRGMLIGNGWFDPVSQYPNYVGYAKARGALTSSIRSSPEYSNMVETDRRCNATLATAAGQGRVLIDTCEALIDAVTAVFRKSAPKGQCVSSYDVRPSAANCGEYPSGLRYATPYLQSQPVVDAFHAANKLTRWVQCNGTVGAEMWSPASRPSVELLPDLLDKVSMLLYAGDADLMCSWTGIESMLNSLTWRGSTGFGNATNDDWFVNGTLSGTWKSARNVTWVKVQEAGHMVPIDKPHAAHDILLRFLGVDTIKAAGSASRIPSHVGKVTDDSNAVIGKVSPDGGTLPAVKSQQAEAAAASASAAAAAVDLHDSVGQPIDRDRELYYGPRRTGVLVLVLMTVIVGFWALLRWRAQERRKKGWKLVKDRNPLSHSTSHRSLSHWTPAATPTSTKEYLNETNIYTGGSIPRSASRGMRPYPLSETNLLQRIEEHEENGWGEAVETSDDTWNDATGSGDAPVGANAHAVPRRP